MIRPQAEADLEEAKSWYEERRAGLGTDLVVEVRGVIGRLRENPGRFPLYYRDFRRVLLRRFPYKVFYAVENDRIIVFRILHTKRNYPPLLPERPR